MNRIERPVVAKFGGSSMATSEFIKQVAEIVVSPNQDRQIVVVSAPGKRFKKDTKVTDILFQCNSLVQEGVEFDEAFGQVVSRFEEIGRGLKIHTSVVGWLNSVYEGVRDNKGKDWSASRGEWVMAQAFAKFLGLGGLFVDADRLIRFAQDGTIDPITYDLIREQLRQDTVYQVIPGFYGQGADGAIKIFSRGGSDITGAIIARGVNARLYENWTDVDGIRAADPEVVKDPKAIREITYREMRELGYRGADVLHTDAIWPVARAGIPINLRNTFNPSDPGTMILSERVSGEDMVIIGIAARQGFTSFQIEKEGMNSKRGVAAQILGVFEKNNVSFEHNPTGLDTMSVILHRDQLDGKVSKILSDLNKAIGPDKLQIIEGIGLICVVGQDIKKYSTSIHAVIYNALKQAGIPILAESYRTSGNNIVIAVPDDYVKQTINTLYDDCMR